MVITESLIFCLIIISFALVAADASAARSILVFKHDEDKVNSLTLLIIFI